MCTNFKYMNTKNLIIYISLVVALMGVLGYWYYGVSQVKAPEVMETPRVFTKETDAVTINITYPTIPGTSEGVARANLAVQSALDKRIAEFEKEADMSMRVDSGFPKDIKSFVTGSPAIEEKNSRYIALVMGLEWYIRGAAHPAHTMDVYVYDYKADKLLSVDDLFLPGVDYLPVLSRLSREDLRMQAQEGDMGFTYNEDMVQDGTEPRKENFSLMLPLRDGLMVYFSEYQVAPYAAGPQQVSIPYNKLEGLFNKDLLQ